MIKTWIIICDECQTEIDATKESYYPNGDDGDLCTRCHNQQGEQEYRKAELEQVTKNQTEWKPTIKIVNNQNETKWLNISIEELRAIRDILLPIKE